MECARPFSSLTNKTAIIFWTAMPLRNRKIEIGGSWVWAMWECGRMKHLLPLCFEDWTKIELLLDTLNHIHNTHTQINSYEKHTTTESHHLVQTIHSFHNYKIKTIGSCIKPPNNAYKINTTSKQSDNLLLSNYISVNVKKPICDLCPLQW